MVYYKKNKNNNLKLSINLENMKDITVFIVEDEALRKKLTEEYFGEGITFCQLFKEENREKVIEAIKDIK